MGVVARTYDPWHTCFRINIATGVLVECAKMLRPRFAFGVCGIGHLVYACGGKDREIKTDETTERYDMLKNKWTLLPECCNMDAAACIDVAVFKSFIYGFGGRYNGRKGKPDTSFERFLRLDTNSLQKGWKTLDLPNPSGIIGF